MNFTKPFLDRANAKLIGEFTARFESVAIHFSELKGEIRIGMTTSYNGLALTGTKGGAAFDKLCFPPLCRKGLPSRYVIGHELMHLVQSKDGSIPLTERSCDIFTLARLPASLLDHPPLYLRMPREVRAAWNSPAFHRELAEAAHLLAIEAMVTRKENARYISWWERRFSEKAARIIGGR